MKHCTQCQKEKDDSLFYGKRKVCKECVQLERKQKEKAYLEKAKEITKECTLCKQTLDGTNFAYDSLMCRTCKAKKNNRVANKPTEDMPDKICSKCTTTKKATEFRYRTNVCIECEKLAMYKWREQNPEKFKEHLQRYRSKPEFKEKYNEYRRNKYNSDIVERIVKRCRQRIRNMIRNKTDGLHYELLGCSYDWLIKWLEYNFGDQYTWDNYGTEWHLDHIRPCASFHMADEKEQKKCFHWTNLAPLSISENTGKKDKINTEYIEYYEKRVMEFLRENPMEVSESYSDTSKLREVPKASTTKVNVKAFAGSGETSEVR